MSFLLLIARRLEGLREEIGMKKVEEIEEIVLPSVVAEIGNTEGAEVDLAVVVECN
jgi:hypothetical protein